MTIDLELEKQCPSCDGKGVVSEWFVEYSSAKYKAGDACPNCKGLKYETTELGDALIEFLERRGLTVKKPYAFRKR